MSTFPTNFAEVKSRYDRLRKQLEASKSRPGGGVPADMLGPHLQGPTSLGPRPKPGSVPPLRLPKRGGGPQRPVNLQSGMINKGGYSGRSGYSDRSGMLRLEPGRKMGTPRRA